MTPALLSAQLNCRGGNDSMQTATRQCNKPCSCMWLALPYVHWCWLTWCRSRGGRLVGAHSTAERPSQTQCSVWLWSGEEEAGRAPACGTSHGPCQPRSTDVGGLGQEAQSNITCCQLWCTTPSGINLWSTQGIHSAYTMHYTGGICTTHVHLVLQVAAGVSLSHSMPSHVYVYSSSIRSESTICTNWGLTVVRWCKENPLLPHRLYPQSVQVDSHKPRHHVQVEHAEGLSPAVVQLHFQTTPLMSSSWHKNTHTHTQSCTHTHTCTHSEDTTVYSTQAAGKR